MSCGDVVESEFTQPTEYHEYKISMNPGDKLQVTNVPIGSYLFTGFSIWEPAGKDILYQYETKQNPRAETDTLSARGDYKILVYNYSRRNLPAFSTHRKVEEEGSAGVYSIYISCTLRDGTQINAGDAQ